MTPTAAMANRRPTNSAPEGDDTRPAPMPMRNYEVAALRADGSLFIGQDNAPALPLFEAAFAAFARGTLIQTVQGDVAIEDLQPGDMINTSSGEPAELVWIGSSNFIPADAGRRMPLIRIMSDSFGEGRPSSFLTVGPAARVLHTPHHLRAEAGGTRLLTPVREFIDGVNVIEVVPPTPVRLFHICLSRHAVIKAGGLEMETFHPGAQATRAVTQNLRDRFLSMFPQIGHATDFGPLAHPRAPEAAPEGDLH
ncbi:Hint domain-containing protein [Sulfitobacter delicatus]|uniref:Hint domain-containing protein n=1 Tax=Sulfitobacter delicatus TaxID=218672 RepID=A0A1G7MQD3_9RHOB|nr:Hint domain-containing protein [Sulfitobacter delicatus]SDF63319.1 Hint domain-containing protein [Sulfitobacter delicatus]